MKLVSISGGKDSTATLLLALERHPKNEVLAVFADTGNEHETTYDYVRYLGKTLDIDIKWIRQDFSDWWWRRRDYVRDKWPEKLRKGTTGRWAWRGLPGLTEVTEKPPVPSDIYVEQQMNGWKWKPATRPMSDAEADSIVLRVLDVFEKGPTGNPYLDLCIIKGRFPSRKAQFCTQYLKTEPLTEYALELIEEYGAVESWQGVRAEESESRALLPEREDRGGGYSIYRPIHKFTVEEVFAVHRKHGIKPNPLYKQGMGRVGCMPCINAAKDELLEISKRFPSEIDRIEEWERIVSDASKRSNSTFMPSPGHNDTAWERGNIRQVVQWSQTQRGGVLMDWVRIYEEPRACASAYGLCE